jgi:hypothetical protein
MTKTRVAVKLQRQFTKYIAQTPKLKMSKTF